MPVTLDVFDAARCERTTLEKFASLRAAHAFLAGYLPSEKALRERESTDQLIVADEATGETYLMVAFPFFGVAVTQDFKGDVEVHRNPAARAAVA